MDARQAGRVVGSALAGLLAGSLLLASVSMAASIADRADVPVEAITGTMVTLAVGAVVLVGIGVITLAVSKNRDILLLSALATLLVLATIAGLFSIGILVLPFAVGAIYLLIRRASGRAGLPGPLLAGPAIAIGLSVLWVVWVQSPLVECAESGVTTSSRPWWNSGAESGEGSSTSAEGDGQASRGTIETPDGRYVFTCQGDELTRFRRIADN